MNEKLYVLDTSVLIHDPEALRSFRGTSVAIPIFVVMELDDLKVSTRHEVSSAARTASRRIARIVSQGDVNNPNGINDPKTGSTFYVVGQDEHFESLQNTTLSRKMDLLILGSALKLQERFANKAVVLVSKDVNLRILAAAKGVGAEDYRKDRVDPNEVPSGVHTQVLTDPDALQPLYGADPPDTVPCVDLDAVSPNEFIRFTGQGFSPQLFRWNGTALRPASRGKGMKFEARNDGQRMALDLLMDPKVHLVVLNGAAGSGKTLLSLMAGLYQLERHYDKIILSKPVVSMGRDLGYLPGPQPLDAKVLTPEGWTTMGAVTVGSKVITRDGTPSRVLGVHPQGTRPVFRVTTTEGTSTECCGEHLWDTQTAEDRKRGRAGSVKSTAEIARTLTTKNGKPNHFLPRNASVQYKGGELPLPAYTLGALLGDGSLGNAIHITNIDPEIIDRVREEVATVGCRLGESWDGVHYPIVGKGGDKNNKPAQPVLVTNVTTGDQRRFSSVGVAASAMGVKGGSMNSLCTRKTTRDGWRYEFLPCEIRWQNRVKDILHTLGVLGTTATTKFIPEVYKVAQEKDRLDLLRGLMDTDGTIGKRGDASFCTTSERLARDVIDLVRSLGGRAVLRSRDRRGRKALLGEREITTQHVSYEFTVSLPEGMNPFHLHRKAARHASAYIHGIGIVSVEQVGEKPVQCILIEHPDHLYVTDDFLVTHNTESDKMHPWMLSFYDNLDQLLTTDAKENKRKGVKEKNWEQLMQSGQVEIQPMHSIRGRSIPRSFMLFDEIQNATPHEVKTVVSRAATGTKVVLCGDPSQIDDPFLDAFSNGLVHAAKMTRESPLAGSVYLGEGVRSPLAELAAKSL